MNSHLKYFNFGSDRPNDDIEISLSESESEDWIISFVATVPHGCESRQIYGDLFSCSILDINDETEPVICGGELEGNIIQKLKNWADDTLSPERQHNLLNCTFTKMTQEMVWQRDVLWFIQVIENRRKNFLDSKV